MLARKVRASVTNGAQDYSLRAKDYNKKKEKLRALRQKAAERNEDEFYFGMMSRKGPGSRIQDGRRWTGTVEGDRGNTSMDVDVVRLLKTQDLGYVRTMRQVTMKEVGKLEEQVVLTRGFDHLDEDDEEEDSGDEDDDEEDSNRLAMPAKPKAPRRILFMDDEEERDEAMEAQMPDEEHDDGLSGGGGEHKPEEPESEKAKSVRRLRHRLDQAKKRLKGLTDVESRLDVQRAKMSKTATSGGETRRGRKLMVRKRKR